MQILVTGGAGFIGSHIVEHHLNAGDHVKVIDNFSAGKEENIQSFKGNDYFQCIHDDMLTYADLGGLVNWADRIYHFAAIVGVFKTLEVPDKVLSVNIGLIERLLKLAKTANKKTRIIFASSSEVYGRKNHKQLQESDDLLVFNQTNHHTEYAVSKITGESFALAYYAQYQIPITVVRLFNTIGPRQTGQYGMVVPRFVAQTISNQPITVYGSGEQTRSFIDVRDLVILLDQVASNAKTAGEIVNLGNDQMISINELAILIKKLANSQSDIVHIPYRDAYNPQFEDFQTRQPNLTEMRKRVTHQNQWTLMRTLTDLIENTPNTGAR